jgi:hypothetical protein
MGIVDETGKPVTLARMDSQTQMAQETAICKV